MATCPNMAYKPHKSALGCTGGSVSPWTSHDDGDVEKPLAVYGAKSHHVTSRTVRKATRDPWITNESAHMGGAQFEPSWLVGRAIPRGARQSRKPKPRYRRYRMYADDGRLVELPSHPFAVLNILECSFVNYIMSHPLLHSAISSSPVIAGFNSQLPGADLPPGSFWVRLGCWVVGLLGCPSCGCLSRVCLGCGCSSCACSSCLSCACSSYLSCLGCLGCWSCWSCWSCLIVLVWVAVV